MPTDAPNATEDEGFFDGRFMVEITAWDWRLYVGLLNQPATPVEYQFQGGLNYSRGIEITGRVRAPSSHRGELVRIWMSPFGPELDFGVGGLDGVGRFYRNRPDAPRPGLEASLDLPESALSHTLTCLSSVWKYLDIWMADDEGDEARITAFSFSASIHPNLIDWAGPELSSQSPTPPHAR